MHCTTTFYLYYISLYTETKMPCFNRVNVLSIVANCHSMKEIRKPIRTKWFWRALASILRVFAVLFPHKNDDNRQFLNYLDKNFSDWLRLTLNKITSTYEKIV